MVLPELSTFPPLAAMTLVMPSLDANVTYLPCAHLSKGIFSTWFYVVFIYHSKGRGVVGYILKGWIIFMGCLQSNCSCRFFQDLNVPFHTSTRNVYLPLNMVMTLCTHRFHPCCTCNKLPPPLTLFPPPPLYQTLIPAHALSECVYLCNPGPVPRHTLVTVPDFKAVP